MNRAERRQAARQHGWKGSKSGRGVSFQEATRRAHAEREQHDLEREREEQRLSVEKIQKAAHATRDMGLVIAGPGL